MSQAGQQHLQLHEICCSLAFSVPVYLVVAKSGPSFQGFAKRVLPEQASPNKLQDLCSIAASAQPVTCPL